eukprot:SAG11_NODE_12478_length_701_cov_1.081395_1_plen_141_part_00
MKHALARSTQQASSAELMSGSSHKGLGQVGIEMGRDADGDGESMQMQQQIMRQQDEVLDDVMAATKRLGAMGQQLGYEIEAQQTLISEVSEDVDATSSKLKATQKKLDKLLQSQSENRLMCMVCTLIGVFAGLTMLVFYT